METDRLTASIPPPPPGFVLNAPEPPPGFKVDEKAEIPPPPAGFVLDAPAGGPGFGPTASIGPKTQETPPLLPSEPEIPEPGPIQGPPRPYSTTATRFTRPVPRELVEDIARIPQTVAETGKTVLGSALSAGAGSMATLDKRADQLDAVVQKIFGKSMKGGIFKKLSEDWGYWGKRLQDEGIKTPVVRDIIAAMGGATYAVPEIMATGGLTQHGALMGFQGDTGAVGTLIGGLSGGLLHGIMKGTAVLPKPFKDVANFTAFAITNPGNIKDRLVGGIVGAALGRVGEQRTVTPQEFFAAYPKIKARIDDKIALRVIEEMYPRFYDAEVIAGGGGPRQTLDKIIVAWDEFQKESAAEQSRVKVQMEEAAAERQRAGYEEKLAGMAERQPEGRKPEELRTWPEVVEEAKVRRQQGVVEPVPGEEVPPAAEAAPAKPIAKAKPQTLLERVGPQLRKKLPVGFPKDAPDLWIDVMHITGGQGVKDSPSWQGPSGKPSEEWLALPKSLRNKNSKFGLDVVAQSLGEKYPKYQGESNADEMLRQDLIDAPRYRTEGEVQTEEGERYRSEYDDAIDRQVKFLQLSKEEQESEIQGILDGLEAMGVKAEVGEAAEPEGPVSEKALEFNPEELGREGRKPEPGVAEDEIEYLPPEGGAEHGAGWSPEAEARMKNNTYSKVDVRTNKETPIPGVDAVDVQPGPFEIIYKTNKITGKKEVVDRGAQVREQRALFKKEPPAPERQPATAEQKAWVDEVFPEAMDRLAVPYEHRGELYQATLRRFRFEDTPEKNAVALDNFIKNTLYQERAHFKYRPLSKGEQGPVHPKGTVKQPLPLPEGEAAEKTPMKQPFEERPEAEATREKELQVKALDILDQFADEETRTALREMREGVPVRESALIEEKGISKSAVQKIRGKIPDGARLIRKAFEDPAAREEAGRRVKQLESKMRAGRALTKDEAFDLVVSKAIKEGPEGVELGMFFAKVPPEFKEAMKRMGEAVRPKAEDVASATKTAGGDIVQRAKELFRSPYWNKTTSPFTRFLVKNDAESARVMRSAERKAKAYIYASKHDTEAMKRINEALVEEDRAGMVLPETELRRKFNFTDADVAAHRGVRSGIRLMQKYEMHKSQVALKNHLQKLLAKEPQAVSSQVWATVEKALGDPGFQEDLVKRVPDLLEKRDRSGAMTDADNSDILAGEYLKDRAMIRGRYLHNPGYVPHSRFGRFAIRVKGIPVDKAGVLLPGGKSKTADFEMFDQESQATRFASGYKVGETVDFEGQKFEITEISQPIDMTKMGIRPEGFMRAVNSFPLYEKMLERRGIKDEEVDKVMKALGEETLRYFAKGRLARRANIAGWSKDIARNLEDFFASFPHAVNRRYTIHGANSMIEGMPEEARPYAQRLLEYWQGKNPRDILASEPKWNQNLRSLVYNWYLGFKPSFYFINAFQPIMTELPLAQKEIGARAVPEFYQASKKSVMIVRDWARARRTDPLADMISVIEKAPYLSVAEKRAASRMAEGGEIGAARTREIIGKSKITGPATWFGEISEKQNRLHGALYGARIGAIKGLKGNEAIDFAREFTGKAEFVYNKATRMEAMRGAMAPVTMFKSYLTNYWNLQNELWKTDKKAFATSMAILLALGGTGGLPLADVGETVLVKALQMLGIIDEKNFRKAKHDFLTKVDDSTKNIVRHGLPALAGIMGDQAFGSGELLGIAPLQAAQGAARFAKGLVQPRGAEWKERVARMAPTEPKHLIRLYQMMHDKTMPTDEYGRPKLTEDDLKVMPKEMRDWAIENWKKLPKASSIGTFEKIAYGLGFPTIQMSKYQEGVYAIKGVAREVRTEKAGMNREVGKIIAEGAPPKVTKWLLEAKPKQFENNFNSLLSKLDQKTKDRIRGVIKDAKAKKYDLDWGSVLSSIKDYLRKGE